MTAFPAACYNSFVVMLRNIAEVAELADALDSKSSGLKTVPVRVRPSAPIAFTAGPQGPAFFLPAYIAIGRPNGLPIAIYRATHDLFCRNDSPFEFFFDEFFYCIGMEDIRNLFIFRIVFILGTGSQHHYG